MEGLPADSSKSISGPDCAGATPTELDVRLLPRSIVLATHYHSDGAPLELEAFLRSRAERLLFIAHPLYEDARPSYWRRYSHGVLVAAGERPGPRGPSRYIQEIVRTNAIAAAAHERFDAFIAADNLLALAGLWLRRRKRVRNVLLYSIDFVPRRFHNQLLNRIYHGVDRFAAQHADLCWGVSEAIFIARQERDKVPARSHQIVVPVGAHFERIRRLPLSEVKAHQIAFVGNLTETQGLQLIIDALPSILSAVPDANLLVLGDGPYLSNLKGHAERRGVQHFVEFAGFIQDHSEIERRLAGSALAVATYVMDPLNFSRFADPMKIKTYLACGLPVIMTDVPQIARSIESQGAGCIVPYDADAAASAIIRYLTEPHRLQQAREAAARFAINYRWDRIFERAFEASMPVLA
jgi:glycosyltransferase involved in cell wall biosynthesis